MKKQIELSERFSLQFSDPSKVASSFTQIETCSLLFLDIPSLNNEEFIDYGVLKTMLNVPLMAFIKKDCYVKPSFIQQFLLNKTIVKPFKMSRLTDEIDELLAELGDKPMGPRRIGEYLFLEDESLLFGPDDSKKIRLTEKETAILIRLSAANGGSVSRNTLLEEVWGYKTGIDSHTLETHIYRLRKKIEELGSSSSFLKTSRDGYKLLFTSN
ncbi:helix-turn-helix domain-containing protein [Alphaproteobacteria bacterium]|nr:helix-turn-helix domain-containing protein [Alphaproteobacteria bacterium]